MCCLGKRIGVLMFFVSLVVLFNVALLEGSTYMTLDELKQCELEQISAKDFTLSFLNEGLRHEAKYYGRPVEIRGKVRFTRRREHILGYSDMRVIVLSGYMNTKESFAGTHLEFLFSNDRLAEFADVQEKDQIVIRGIYIGEYSDPNDMYDVLAFVNPIIVSHKKTDPEVAKMIKQAEAEYFNKNYAKAKELSKKALNIDPENADALSVLGACEDYFKNYDLALKYFEEACRFDPDEPINFYNQGRVYITIGKKDKAKEIIEYMEREFPFDQYTERLKEAYKNNWVN